MLGKLLYAFAHKDDVFIPFLVNETLEPIEVTGHLLSHPLSALSSAP
jgi:hypothetical protein